ncbi:MFS transporter [Paraburkholderia acidicola]|uniref:MFS transporter n=2 Tax=Paraburkholderia acidicola TaxID=1912599 RepID=A0A2A4EPX9_9BURK|nr:MFS transporter [Paraburkholderia acidicola]
MNTDPSRLSVQPHSPAVSLDLRTTLAMAVACGIAIANIYYNQPMLGLMEASFPGATAITGLVPTATQLGYALGLILLIPLGDRIERRRLIFMQLAALGVALVALALAPSAWALVVTSAVVGILSTVAQQIVPFAAELAEPHRRGATIGTVMSGLLCGILFARTLAGFVAAHYGWRAMFGLGPLLVFGALLLLATVLPKSTPKTQARYSELLRSLADLWREEPELRRATAVQAMLFASFSAFWTLLTLHLARDYQLGAEVAGLFGIIGAGGVLIAPMAGRFADRRGPYAVIGLSCVVMLGSWIVFACWGSIAGLIAGVILLDFGQQGSLVSNQHVIYALRPEARNRMNTIFMGGMFLGAALGSAGATFAWQVARWPAVCAIGGGFVAIALAAHSAGARRLARAQQG